MRDSAFLNMLGAGVAHQRRYSAALLSFRAVPCLGTVRHVTSSDEVGYEWLSQTAAGPGPYLINACCFTFLEGIDAEEMSRRAEMTSVECVDLSTTSDPFMRLDQDMAAAFNQDGWAVLYQDNGYPGQVANRLAAAADVARAVIVFWNVNGVVELSYWEDGAVSRAARDLPVGAPVGGAGSGGKRYGARERSIRADTSVDLARRWTDSRRKDRVRSVRPRRSLPASACTGESLGRRGCESRAARGAAYRLSGRV